MLVLGYLGTMARHIIKITDPEDKKEYYIEWSNVTGSACSSGHSLEDFTTYYRNRYGEDKEKYLNAHLARIKETGNISSYFWTLDDILTMAEKTETDLLNEYCRNQDDGDHSG